MAIEHPRLKLGKSAAFVKSQIKRLPQVDKSWEARRPRQLHLRGNPRWEELFPHLKEIGVELSIQDDLPMLEIVHEDFLRQMRKGGAGLRIVYFSGPPPVTDQFPAISKWVREHGRIEVGRREAGFLARALDDAGLVFENNGCDTLDAAMAALDEGLAGRFRDQKAALRSASPKDAKRQRSIN